MYIDVRDTNGQELELFLKKYIKNNNKIKFYVDVAENLDLSNVIISNVVIHFIVDTLNLKDQDQINYKQGIGIDFFTEETFKIRYVFFANTFRVIIYCEDLREVISYFEIPFENIDFTKINNFKKNVTEKIKLIEFALKNIPFEFE